MDGVRWGWLYQNGDGRYTLPDALGSTAVLAQDGTVEASRLYPFGEEAQATGAEYKSTNQIRDGKGLDHFAFRTYSSNLARWLSPDPAGLAAVSPADPQSWNRYAYVRNQPLSAIDPLGLSPSVYATVYLSWMSFDEWLQETRFDLGGGWGAPAVPHSDAKPDHPYSPGTGSFSGLTATGAGTPTGQGVPPLAPPSGFDLSDPTQRALYTLALAGQEAAFIRDPKFIALWYAAPLIGSGLAELAGPYAAPAAQIALEGAEAAYRSGRQTAANFEVAHPELDRFMTDFVSAFLPGSPPTPSSGQLVSLATQLLLRFPGW